MSWPISLGGGLADYFISVMHISKMVFNLYHNDVVNRKDGGGAWAC